MERKRTEQIKKEHFKRVIQARYQQMGLLRLRVFIHRKADLIYLFSKVDRDNKQPELAWEEHLVLKIDLHSILWKPLFTHSC